MLCQLSDSAGLFLTTPVRNRVMNLVSREITTSHETSVPFNLPVLLFKVHSLHRM